MGIDEILKLIESIQDTDIQELEISNGDSKVRIARLMPAPIASTLQSYQPMPIPVAPLTAEVSTEDEEGKVNHSYIEVTSPMVGTFYCASEPDSDPFVRESDEVITGQQLCIIEAMKLMNPILSETTGRIVKILAKDAQPVEYGQPLFLLEPT
jgi:acetyl-CoA carboxylase biotin carboxyl carrier protein